MKIKHKELEVPGEKPFANCKLDRAKYAEVLTSIVNTYADGFVLAINNEWGTGKTTFVKMWQQSLKNEGFQTIYFNVWEHDFDSNPLVAIMSELKTLITKDNKTLFKSVLQKGAVLTKNVLPEILKAVAKRYIDTEAFIDAIENTTKGATEILEDEIKEYATKKKTITEFRSELEKFINKTDNAKPLVFIIDELDRCRPDYAVEVLEQMKHFFSVPGIVFVLSIDKNHLASSVKGYYGSEQINTEEYLRRFIDLEYSIPKPSADAFCNYLFDYYSFEKFFLSEERRKHYIFNDDTDLLLDMAKLLFNKYNVTLRQQEKIFGQTRLIVASFKSNQYAFTPVLVFLIFIKSFRTELYRKIEDNALTLQELSDAFTDVISVGPKSVNLIYVQALLLNFYNNINEREDRIKLYMMKEEKPVSHITSKLENVKENMTLGECFESINRERNYSYTSMNYLLNKINLTEPVIMQ